MASNTPQLNKKNKENKPTIYILDPIHPQATKHAQTLFHTILPDDPECANWRQNATAILVRGRFITASDIHSSPHLTVISKHGVGLDKIDHEACATRGITILNTPGSNAREVAELVLGLTLAVARGFRSIITRQQTEAAVSRESCLGLSLSGKTVGIIGMGNIGRQVAEIFRGAFNARILAYGPSRPEGTWSDLVHERAQTLDEVLVGSDVVTICVPLTVHTKGLIAYSELKRMKADAILINAARGGIVVEEDLDRVLREGHLWGAGLDCHAQEPPTRERYASLWENLNVISTPHIGAATASAQVASGMAAVNNLHDYFNSR